LLLTSRFTVTNLERTGDSGHWNSGAHPPEASRHGFRREGMADLALRAVPAPVPLGNPERLQMPSNRVLVVEDDPSVRGLLQTILEDEALEVILAADGEEGLHLARTLDVMMPGLGGPDVIRRLRRPDGSLPFAVLVVTGAAEVIAPLRSELGPEAVLEKPFDITTLATRVKSLAGGAAHRSANDQT
jgi:CheY-like chemotaxis protein